MDKFFAAVRNMFNVPDLRRRILFTLGMLAVYRLGAHVPTPGINKDRLDQVWNDVAGTLLGVLDLFSGGNFRTISIFALGVTPYITASIILQLMTVVSPAAQEAAGRRRDGPAEDQPVDPLSDGAAGRNSNFLCGPLAAGQRSGRAHLGISAVDRAHSNHRDHLCDVAG